MTLKRTPSDDAAKRVAAPLVRTQIGARVPLADPSPFRLSAYRPEQDGPLRQAELFYLKKQIQAQTPMVIVLEDGEIIEGLIEWYDRETLKVRGRAKTLVYKSSIRYMYKLGDQGQG